MAYAHAALLTRLAAACSSLSEEELMNVIIKPDTSAPTPGKMRRVESDKSAQLMLLACAADATGL